MYWISYILKGLKQLFPMPLKVKVSYIDYVECVTNIFILRLETDLEPEPEIVSEHWASHTSVS